MSGSSNDPNSQENWDAIWANEGADTWRTYPKLYDRILRIVPANARVFDIGCGVGKLLDRLRDEKKCVTEGIDVSAVAVEHARNNGHRAWVFPLSKESLGRLTIDADVVIATEFIEHLDNETLHGLLYRIAQRQFKAVFAVPNNCLGPDEEPQHQQKWTAVEFKHLLEMYFHSVRVECIDEGAPRLLGVCNFPKPYKLAFTMPVKNEGEDIERVLKSFRGACDYMVIGIDRASTDATEAIARNYADRVFHFTWENSFCKARNACIEQCRQLLPSSNDWIFMSEGHEHLENGLDELLNLDQVPASAHVIEVRREDREHAWMFPWLFRNRDDIFFENDSHNALAWDDAKSQSMQIPAINTWHARSENNARERAEQRRGMNRQNLIRRLTEDPSDSRSCYYLANEWRREDLNRAIHYYQRYLAMPGKNKPERYQARLSLAECLIQRVQENADTLKSDLMTSSQVRYIEHQQQHDLQLAYDTLIGAAADDWMRNEHWMHLGDLCYAQGNRLAQAMRFYELAAVSIGRQPVTYMWITKANYTWMPAQKLVVVYAEAGLLKEALHWCDRVAELLPSWAPSAAHDEVQQHRETIIEKLKEIAE